jgi:nickel/cobalt exporter
MPDLNALLQQGSAYGWLFVPSAIFSAPCMASNPAIQDHDGGLHRCDPQHGAAEAVLLGLAATVSHLWFVWLIAIAGMQLGEQVERRGRRTWLQSIAAAIVIRVGLDDRAHRAPASRAA